MSRTLACALALYLSISSSTYGASFSLVPDALGGHFWDVLRLSSDGRTFFGVSHGPVQEVFRWTADEGYVVTGIVPSEIRSLPVLPTGISEDGQTVIGGTRDLTYPTTGFRWTAETGLVEISPPAGFGFFAGPMAMSPDGSVIVGVTKSGFTTEFDGTPFRWTEATGAVPIDLPGRPNAVSADGTTVVGSMTIHDTSVFPPKANYFGYRWSPNGVDNVGHMQDSWQPFSEATLVSADGKVVAGYGFPPDARIGPQHFRWTAETGMQHLGMLGDSAEAIGMSPDGSVIIGRFISLIPEADRFATRIQPYVWTAEAGLRTLHEVLTSLDVAEDTWFGDYNTSHYIHAVSPNGQFIFGASARSSAAYYDQRFIDAERWWIVDLAPVPEPSTAVLAALGTLVLAGRRTRRSG